MPFFSTYYKARYLALVVSLYLIYLPAQAQTSTISSLKKQLAVAKADSSRYRLLYELGKQYEQSNPDSCYYYYDQSLQVAKSSRNHQARAKAMHALAFYYIYLKNNHAKAITLLNQAIAIAKPQQDFLNLARCFQLLGILAYNQDIENPDALFDKAISYGQQANDWKVLTDIYDAYAGFSQRAQKYKKAETLTLKAMETCQQHDIDTWFSLGLDNADVLKQQGKNANALAMYRKLSAVKNQLKKTKGEFVYMNDLARLELGQSNYAAAEAILLKRLETEKAQKIPDTLHIITLYRTLLPIYEAQGAYKKAYEVYQKRAELNVDILRKILSKDSKVQMTQLKAASDLEKKELEITLLETQKKEQQLFLVIAVLIAVLLISFLIILQRNKQRIERQKVELSSLNTTKDKLFAILSHDLRSPLASLKNYMMLINWGVLNQQEFEKSAQRLSTQLNNVHDMLENVLNWSISQLNGIKPKLEHLTVSTILQEQIQLLLPIAEAKRIQITNHIPDEAVIHADKNHTVVIFRNLLQNAVKFTNVGGKIWVYYLENEDKCQIEVTDNGIGISNHKLAKLFQLEKQTSSLGTALEQGTGLGLVLTKELVELNGGTIAVQSAIDEGTTLTLTFNKKELPYY